MLIFSHNNRSLVANWWWTVDKTLLACISILIVLGILLTFSASPAVATRIGFDSYHFIKRHLFFAPLAYMVMIALSMQKLKFIRRLSLVGYLAAIALVVCTFFFGEANKAAACCPLCGERRQYEFHKQIIRRVPDYKNNCTKWVEGA